MYSAGLSLCNWVCRMTWHLGVMLHHSKHHWHGFFNFSLISFLPSFKTNVSLKHPANVSVENSFSLMQENMSFCASDLQCVILWMSNSVFMLNSDSILVPTYLTTSPPHLHSNLCLSCLLIDVNLERAINRELDSVEHFSALRLFHDLNDLLKLQTKKLAIEIHTETTVSENQISM